MYCARSSWNPGDTTTSGRGPADDGVNTVAITVRVLLVPGIDAVLVVDVFGPGVAGSTLLIGASTVAVGASIPEPLPGPASGSPPPGLLESLPHAARSRTNRCL